MGLTTHVLDTAHGCPAAGMKIDLYAESGDGRKLVKSVVTNRDGRCDGPLFADGELRAGRYALEFHVADYFRKKGVALPDPPFVEIPVIRFGVAAPDQHYHVPLLVSPWSFSTYRGS